MLSFFRRQEGLEEAEGLVLEMLTEVGAIYEAATDAAFGGGKSKATRLEVRTGDDRVEALRRDAIRRLAIHGSVSPTGFSDTLPYLLVVRDAERASDYAKNIYDLAKYGFDLSTMPGSDQLEADRGVVQGLIERARAVFEDDDETTARAFVADTDQLTEQFDRSVREAATSSSSGPEAVSKALYYRYLKRITAHLAALVSSLYVPVELIDDQLDENGDG